MVTTKSKQSSARSRDSGIAVPSAPQPLDVERIRKKGVAAQKARQTEDKHLYFKGVAEARYVIRKVFRIVEDQAKKYGIDPLAHQALIQIYGSENMELQVNQIASRLDTDDSSRTKVAIAINADSLATWFGPVACAIAKENVALELIVDDQDHTLAVLARGEAMGCVSTAQTAPTGFVAEPIGAMEYECVASPSFVEANFAQGLNLRDILAAPAVLFNRKDGRKR